MGRIKTTPIKRATMSLYNAHKENFTTDFNENKKHVDEHLLIKSKKIRNVIAGYMTRLMGKSKTE
jgi:small subunit ribosomal protein S17e